MESLLSLTSRRAGEWFKEELRSLGALDHIVDTGRLLCIYNWSFQWFKAGFLMMRLI